MTTLALHRRPSLRERTASADLQPSELRAAFESARSALKDAARTLLDWLLESTPFGRGVRELSVCGTTLAAELRMSYPAFQRAIRRLESDGFLTHLKHRGETVLAPAAWLETALRASIQRLLPCFLAEAEPQPKAQAKTAPLPQAPAARSHVATPEPASRPAPPREDAKDAPFPAATPPAETACALPPLDDAAAEAELLALAAAKAKPPAVAAGSLPPRASACPPARHDHPSHLPGKAKSSGHSGSGMGDDPAARRKDEPRTMGDLAPALLAAVPSTDPQPAAPVAPEAWKQITARADSLAAAVADPAADPRIFLWAAIQESPVVVPGWRRASRLGAKFLDFAASACRKAAKPGAYFVTALKNTIVKIGGEWKGLQSVSRLVAHLTGGAV